MATMHIHFMYFEDCPSHQDALKRLKEIVKQDGINAEIVISKVETEADALRLNFLGSPTILVNGTDIDPDAGALTPGLACRAYRKGDGAITPLPPASMIKKAIQTAHNRSR